MKEFEDYLREWMTRGLEILRKSKNTIACESELLSAYLRLSNEQEIAWDLAKLKEHENEFYQKLVKAVEELENEEGNCK